MNPQKHRGWRIILPGETKSERYLIKSEGYLTKSERYLIKSEGYSPPQLRYLSDKVHTTSNSEGCEGFFCKIKLEMVQVKHIAQFVSTNCSKSIYFLPRKIYLFSSNLIKNDSYWIAFSMISTQPKSEMHAWMSFTTSECYAFWILQLLILRQNKYKKKTILSSGIQLKKFSCIFAVTQ